MSTAADHFTSFVEALADVLGDHDATGEALARRLYVSRFHLDRIISPVEEHQSVASLREQLAAAGPTYLSHVREVVEEGRLDDTFVDAICEPAEVFTYGGMIAHVLTFAAHRRTLVALSLDAAGIDDLGWGDPMRWVAHPH